MSFIATEKSDFTLENIPFGIISTAQDLRHRPATAIGDFAVDLKTLADAGAFQGPLMSKYAIHNTLNAFMALGREYWRETRATLQDLLSVNGSALLRDNPALQSRALIPLSLVTNHLPAVIGDYTDFYASKEHATNVGTMFRGKDNALMPNWVHIPVGYHGRASSVVVSGTPIKRPSGMVWDAEKKPQFSVCKKVDIELEVAFFVGTGNELGDRIPIEEAEKHIFGMVLMNDWSARDIQQFEYVPLGPFLGKNFGTTISPWIVTMDALEAFRVPLPIQDPTPSEYLLDKSSDRDAYDVALKVEIKAKGAANATVVSKSNLKYMYWSFKQQLAHHSINGCNMRTGDLLGSGTISGPTEDSYGSLLELTWNASKELVLENGEKRTFLQDGDEVIITGSCSDGNKRLGFGSCAGVIMPAPFSSRNQIIMLGEDIQTMKKRQKNDDGTLPDDQCLDQSSKKLKVAWEDDIPESWRQLIEKELKREYFIKMIKKIKKEEENGIIIFPKPIDRFNFMRFCDPLDLKVVIIGQDPYHGLNQAHGLAFSVQAGVKIPPSLVNIYKELKSDLGDRFNIPNHGNLEGWARQGVLLLNASLTVVQAKPNSHAKYGWMDFTDTIIKELNKSHPGLVFMLWGKAMFIVGGFAQKKGSCINSNKHLVLKASHPSPLGANKGGWWGTKHFSKANGWLEKKGLGAIEWNNLALSS